MIKGSGICMLQAKSKNGKIITPARLTKKELDVIRGQPFYCPTCTEKVYLRAGEYVTPHFSHYKSAECIYGSGESDYHRQGKLMLYDWIKNQSIPVILEPYLKAINQWPDLLLKLNQKQIVIEFQCAKITPSEIRARTNGYKEIKMYPIWILGANRLRRIGKHKLKIDIFTLQMLQQFSPAHPIQLLYFDPEINNFLLVSDPYMTNSQQAIARFTFYKANQIKISGLFKRKKIPLHQIYNQWYSEKQTLRMSNSKIYGSESAFRSWLYHHRLHLEHLPGIIYLPNPAQHMMNVPLWHWQSYFVVGFLHPIKVGGSFRMRNVKAFLAPFVDSSMINADIYSNDPVQIYLRQLEKLGILQFHTNGNIMKRRPIRFYRHIEEAIRGDRAVLEKLEMEYRLKD